MNETIKSHYSQLFLCFCSLCAITLTCRCIWNYSLNEDVAQIEFTEFHKTEDDVYPSISFCLLNPFIQHELFKYTSNLTIQSYQSVLKGDCQLGRSVEGKPMWVDGKSILYDKESIWCLDQKWNQTLMDVDYDEVTFRLKDFLTGFSINFISHSETENHLISFVVVNDSLLQYWASDQAFKMVKEINYYISARQSQYKCFSFDVPFVQGKYVKTLELNVNASIFPSGKITPGDGNSDYFVAFGYPNQFIRSSQRNKVVDKMQGLSTSCYKQETLVGSMETIQRRDKSNDRCNPYWRNHDRHVLNNIAKKIGCIPKYWKIASQLANCSTHQQHLLIYKEFNAMNISIPPCKSIEKLAQTTYGTDLGIRCTLTGSAHSQLILNMDFSKETMYKKIELVRAYSLESLVGNAGKNK